MNVPFRMEDKQLQKCALEGNRDYVVSEILGIQPQFMDLCFQNVGSDAT